MYIFLYLYIFCSLIRSSWEVTMTVDPAWEPCPRAVCSVATLCARHLCLLVCKSEAGRCPPRSFTRAKVLSVLGSQPPPPCPQMILKRSFTRAKVLSILGSQPPPPCPQMILKCSVFGQLESWQRQGPCPPPACVTVPGSAARWSPVAGP